MIYETHNLTEAARPLRPNSPHFLLNTSSFLREWTTRLSRYPQCFKHFFLPDSAISVWLWPSCLIPIILCIEKSERPKARCETRRRAILGEGYARVLGEGYASLLGGDRRPRHVSGSIHCFNGELVDHRFWFAKFTAKVMRMFNFSVSVNRFVPATIQEATNYMCSLHRD